MANLAFLAVVLNKVPRTLAVCCQRRLLPHRLTESLVHELGSEILGHVSDHLSCFLSIHQMEEIVPALFIAGS